MKGLISTIQRYSLKDGPGIRSTVFLMGCNLRCRWCSNPELLLAKQRVMVFSNRCIGCGSCLDIDDEHALSLINNQLTFDASKNLDRFIEACPYDVFKSVGEEIEARELADRLIRDKLFFDQSGGGVTFSGGEPMLQVDFVLETAKILQTNGISVAIETAGDVDYDQFKKLNPYVDLYLFDLKCLDPILHEKITGSRNEQILSNLDRLVEDGEMIILRLVIIPAINESAEEMFNKSNYLKKFRGNIARIDLLEYHNLGAGKYRALKEKYPFNENIKCDPDKVKKFATSLRELGFIVHIENAI